MSKQAYTTKEEAIAAVEAINCGGFSVVWISKTYAHFDNVEDNAWYVMSDLTRKVI